MSRLLFIIKIALTLMRATLFATAIENAEKRIVIYNPHMQLSEQFTHTPLGSFLAACYTPALAIDSLVPPHLSINERYECDFKIPIISEKVINPFCIIKTMHLTPIEVFWMGVINRRIIKNSSNRPASDLQIKQDSILSKEEEHVYTVLTHLGATLHPAQEASCRENMITMQLKNYREIYKEK